MTFTPPVCRVCPPRPRQVVQNGCLAAHVAGIHGNLSWGKEAKLLVSLGNCLRHFPCIFITKDTQETNVNHQMHTITVFIIQLLTKNNNYTAKAVLEARGRKAKRRDAYLQRQQRPAPLS